MADVRIRRGSEAWLELADAMADDRVETIELVIRNQMNNHYVQLLIPGRPVTPRLVASLDVPDDPPF
jgi:hypothetical protein